MNDQHHDTSADEHALRRQRNRESMRRVRRRKRDARQLTQQTAVQLQRQLRALVEHNRLASALVASGGVNNSADAPRGGGLAAPYSRLLSETAALSLENQQLRDKVHGFQALEASLSRSLDDQRLERTERERGLQRSVCDEQQRDGMEMLAPLLAWLTPSALAGLMDLARARILANMALIESLVPHANVALGWSDQRCVEGRFARYLLRKTFHHEATRTLTQRTWAATTDIEQLSGIMRWAQGMKVLHWLSADAAVVMRELEIPNPRGDDLPTKFRFMLLVFRMKWRGSEGDSMPSDNQRSSSAEQKQVGPEQQGEGGEEEEDCYLVGTITLNIYGSSVAECLQKHVAYGDGVSAHTMYGFLFRRRRDAHGRESGCETTLVGLTGNGSDAYAHNVLMEMITVVLLWENALVGPILRLQH